MEVESAHRAGRLVKMLTPLRLSSYMSEPPNVVAALELYEWNIEAGAAVMATSAMIEVVVRNAMDAALVDWASARGLDDWLDAPVLDSRAAQDISKARLLLSRKSGNTALRRPIAELSFGFWRYLSSSRYLTTLWVPSLHNAFPFGAESPQICRQAVDFSLQQLLYLRNRAAHHEPIHKRDLLRDNALAINLASMIDPVAGEWVEMRSTIPMVVAKKPETVT